MVRIRTTVRGPRVSWCVLFAVLAGGCVNVPGDITFSSATARPTATFATVPPTATPTETITPTATDTPTPTVTPTPDLSGLATPVPGTSVVFDLDADLSAPRTFYDLPYPSDLRLAADGRADMSGFPFPVGNVTIESLLTIAGDRFGFSTLPVAYFRFSAPVREQNLDDVIPPAVGAPILLLDIDAGSPERGRLFPVIATNPPPDAYVPSSLLAVSSVPGIVLQPNRRYAVVIMRFLRDATGASLGVPASFAQLRSGLHPAGSRGEAAFEQYVDLWETLDALAVPRADVAAATVFTTGDVVSDLATLSARAISRYDVAISDFSLVSLDGTQPERFCELAATASMPQFQRGTPPFATDGLFDFDSTGTPVLQGEQSVPIVLTLPRSPMPANGYPLVMYMHSPGGLSSDVADRGAIQVSGGAPVAGEGPAHVLAAHGFATLGSALPLNPERYPAGAVRPDLNLVNLAAYRDTFRQGVVEQRLLLDALSRVEIDPAVLAGCPGPALPDGATHFFVRVDPAYVLGHSTGAQYAIAVAAVEPHVAALVPAGAGGLWAVQLLTAPVLPGIDPGTIGPTVFGTAAPLTHVHPALQLFESAWEAAEPIAFAPRVARRALRAHNARPIYQPAGEADPDAPEPVYDAMALAFGTQQAGNIFWSSMQAALSADGLGGLASYPVAQNRTTTEGDAFTAAVVQYEADGIASSDEIVFQLDAVKFQYGCFLDSLERTGVAVLPAPQPLGSDCGP